MANREYDFTPGFSSSTPPTLGTPTSDDDLITLGYAEDNFTDKHEVFGITDTISSLRAIGSAERFNKQLIFVNGTTTFYVFDSAGSGTDDGDLIIEPTVGTGQWNKVEFTAGSGGTASGLESLMQKLENEKYGITTENLDFAAGVSGGYQTPDQAISGNLMQNAGTGDTTLYVSWNPVFLNTSDKNTDTSTNWAAFDAGTNMLATNTTRKVGATSLSFDKNGTNVRAGLTYDYGSAAFNFGANKYMQFWINLPSITGLTNVFIYLAPSAGNYDEFTTTTNSAGGALATGWNHIKFDCYAAPASTTGTGYTFGDLVRYVSIGVNTTAGGAGQTYTDVLLDAVNWSLTDANKLVGHMGNEFSFYDTSNQVQKVFTFATANEGATTISAAIGTAFNGGFSNSDRCMIERSTLSNAGNDQIEWTSGLSGDVSTTQYIRSGAFFRQSESMNLSAFVDIYADVYPITAVGGASIDVTSNVDLTAMFASGDLIDIYRPLYIQGETFYQPILSTTTNGADSYSSPTMTLPLTSVSGVAIGDVACRRPVTEMAVSLVAANTVEAFSVASTLASPEGVQLINQGLSYPKQENIVAHWSLGGFTNAEGTRNRKGTAGSLSVFGSPSLQSSFRAGRYSVTNFSNSNWLKYNSGSVTGFDGSGELVETSIWFYAASSFTGSSRYILSFNDGVGNRLGLGLASGADNVFVDENASLHTVAAFSVNTWNNIFLSSNNGGTMSVYLNGVLGYTMAAPSTPASTELWIGQGNSGTLHAGGNTQLADLVLWSGGSAMPTSQISTIYNAGVYKPFGAQVQRLVYDINGVSGQKLSQRVKMQRNSTTFNHNISKFGVIQK